MQILIFNRVLYLFTGNSYGDYTPSNIYNHSIKVLSLFHESIGKESRGFVSLGEFKESMVLNAILLALPAGNVKYLRGLLDNPLKGGAASFELIHLYNLIVLVLLLDISISIHLSKQYESTEEEDSKEIMEEVLGDLLVLQKRLKNSLTGGLRSSLSMNRLSFEDRVYTGFDTEFDNLDNRKNELLCMTTASERRVMLRIRNVLFDFDVTNNPESVLTKVDKRPSVEGMLKCLVLGIRYFNDKHDSEITTLATALTDSPSITSYPSKKETLFTFKNPLSPENFIVTYADVTGNDRGIISFTNLHNLSLKVTRTKGEAAFKLWRELLKSELKYGELSTTGRIDVGKIRVNKSLFLIAHYTPADLSFLHDLQDYKNKLKLLGKNIITLKAFKAEGCTYKINIRDTSLLAPSRPSLGEISKLYQHPLLEKLSVGDYKKSMGLLKRENPGLFVKYAVNDAIITLYHAMTVEESNYTQTRNLAIPVTLSSLASQYLTSVIGGPRYDLPTKNGQYNVKDLPLLHTPTGIESSGGLADWLNLFVASYKGGRNENFVYGRTDGKVLDIDLRSAYPVGLSMLEYPGYKKMKRILPCTGDELVQEYGLQLIRSFSSFKIKFIFPEGTMFPNIPTRLDKGSIIFLKEGEGYCTGVELYFAVNTLNCEVSVLEGVMIPFLSDKERDKDMQEERVEEISQLADQSEESKEKAKALKMAWKEAWLEFSNLYPARPRVESDKSRGEITKFFELFKEYYQTSKFEWMTVRQESGGLQTVQGIKLDDIECVLFDPLTQSNRSENW